MNSGYIIAGEKENDRMGMQIANQSLGSCYEEMKQYDEVEKYYKWPWMRQSNQILMKS